MAASAVTGAETTSRAVVGAEEHLMVVSRRARGGDMLTAALRYNSAGAHEKPAYGDLMIEPAPAPELEVAAMHEPRRCQPPRQGTYLEARCECINWIH